MSRLQLALNVDDLDAAVPFYSILFGAEPAKRRHGYANFVIAESPLELVRFEQAGKVGTLNHLGVEVESADLIGAVQARLAEAGLATAAEDGVSCSDARQDKVWVDGPSGEPWEIDTLLEDVEVPAGQLRTVDPDNGTACCATLGEDGLVVAGSADCR